MDSDLLVQSLLQLGFALLVARGLIAMGLAAKLQVVLQFPAKHRSD